VASLDPSTPLVVVGTLLRAFFFELPEPLVPANLWGSFREAAEGSDELRRASELQRLLLSLPPARRPLVFAFLNFFSVLSAGAGAAGWAGVLARPEARTAETLAPAERSASVALCAVLLRLAPFK
jgi:hypothetical protein